MKGKKKITLWGGFHNSPETTVWLPLLDYQSLMDGENNLTDIITGLGASTELRLKNHFCGISGCCCGSYARASYELDNI